MLDELLDMLLAGHGNDAHIIATNSTNVLMEVDGVIWNYVYDFPRKTWRFIQQWRTF